MFKISHFYIFKCVNIFIIIYLNYKLFINIQIIIYNKMNDINNNMISLVKKTLPEIDLKLSNQIIECINDVTNITDNEKIQLNIY